MVLRSKRWVNFGFGPLLDYLVFGKESVGLGPELLECESANTYRIPHAPTIRSLNLANAAAVAVYEAWRQFGFGGA